MDGVTILTTHVYREMDLFSSIFCSILLFIFFVILCVGFCLLFSDSNHSTLINIFIVLLNLVIYLAIELTVYNNYQTIYTDHIVVIDDSVNFNELTDKYEIISKDGDLYTVREMGSEDED